MYETAKVEPSVYQVTHVLNNNAVVVRSGAGTSILEGRDLGFGCKPDDVVSVNDPQEHYVAFEQNNLHYLAMLNSLSPDLLSAIAHGVEKAEDLRGDLNPSIYMLLTDRLTSAVERFGEGTTIHNNLLAEIHAVFPAEFKAACRVLEYVNDALNATLSDGTVRGPLSKAHTVAELTTTTLGRMDVKECRRSTREALTTELVALPERLDSGRAHPCAAYLSIARELPNEWAHAKQIVETLLASLAATTAAPGHEQRTGEIAYLAVFLYGWSHDAAHLPPSP